MIWFRFRMCINKLYDKDLFISLLSEKCDQASCILLIEISSIFSFLENSNYSNTLFHSGNYSDSHLSYSVDISQDKHAGFIPLFRGKVREARLPQRPVAQLQPGWRMPRPRRYRIIASAAVPPLQWVVCPRPTPVTTVRRLSRTSFVTQIILGPYSSKMSVLPLTRLRTEYTKHHAR